MATWRSGLPKSLEIEADTVEQVSPRLLPKLVLIHTAYHQCVMALHASIVPVYSWSLAAESRASALQLSAQIAYEHACTASRLFEAVLRTVDNMSTMPSFIGYAAYCGCAILIPFLWCTEDTVRSRAHANVKTNARLLHSMSHYWKFSSLSVGSDSSEVTTESAEAYR